jgi:sugar-specific transcriptional regulator TrmB
MNKDILENLTKIGLGKNEAEVYLTLLELGESKVGNLSAQSKVPTSHIYPILQSLYTKGLVSYKYANNVKIYYSNRPEALKSLYIEKQKKLVEEEKLLINAIESIKHIPRVNDTFADYKYFEGVSGIIAMWQEIIAQMIPNTEIQILSSNEEALDRFNPIFMEFQKERVKRKIKQRLLFPKEMNKKYSAERKKLGLIDIKYTDLDQKAEICLFQDYIAIEYLGVGGDKPRAFLIKDKLFVDYFKSIFEVFWKIARK